MYISAKLPRIERGEIGRVKGRCANTFLIKGEACLYQRDQSGFFNEFLLNKIFRNNLKVPSLKEDAITFDQVAQQYVVKVGNSLYEVSLPDPVTTCSDKIVRQRYTSARLSEQMITIGPEPLHTRLHSVLSRGYRR
jgi:hypothetical protein